MYGKHFESMYTGSMIGSGAEVFAVWGYVIANRRKDLVELNPVLLAFVLGEPIERICDAIETLCSPDPKSRTKEEDGRRLIKEGEYLYRVVNARRYDQEANEYSRRERDKFRKREERAGEAEECSTRHNELPKTQFVKPEQEQVKLLAAKMGLPAVEADKFWAYYESNGWKVGRNKMVDWHKALAGWKMRYEDNRGNNKAGGGLGKRGFDRNAGTFNAGTTEQYDTAKIQAARELREQQSGERKAPV